MKNEKDKKIASLETEIQRYKTTLSKMEKQWREAVAAANNSTLQMKINDLNTQNQTLNNQVIDLKTENQVLKLKLHTQREEGVVDGPTISKEEYDKTKAENLELFQKIQQMKEKEIETHRTAANASVPLSEVPSEQQND